MITEQELQELIAERDAAHVKVALLERAHEELRHRYKSVDDEYHKLLRTLVELTGSPGNASMLHCAVEERDAALDNVHKLLERAQSERLVREAAQTVIVEWGQLPSHTTVPGGLVAAVFALGKALIRPEESEPTDPALEPNDDLAKATRRLLRALRSPISEVTYRSGGPSPYSLAVHSAMTAVEAILRERDTASDVTKVSQVDTPESPLYRAEPPWPATKPWIQGGVPREVLRGCSVCQQEVPVKRFAYRTDLQSAEKVIGLEMPLDDPRTWHLCFVCATTLISESNASKYKSENRILGALANIILDAIDTGEDPRAGWGEPAPTEE